MTRAHTPPSGARTGGSALKSWRPEILDAYLNVTGEQPLWQRLLTAGAPLQSKGKHGVVATTSCAFAAHAGIEVLRQGGSAVDGAVAVALAQVVLHLGGATSYAGQMAIGCYQANSRAVDFLSAGYATVLQENDPQSIPPYGVPSGRAVMVPGFIAGIAEAHGRYGRLPFADLFEPAVVLAEEGFVLSEMMAATIRQRQYVLTRRPEGRALFLRDGKLPTVGDRVHQPELAAFLRRVAAGGPATMYEGEWGREFVRAVRSEGGQMTMDDLRRYRPVWWQPQAAEVRGYQLYGGKPVQERLRLVQLANLRAMGHYSRSPEALYWLIKISRATDVLGPHMSGSGVPREEIEAACPELNLSHSARFTPDMAEKIWAAMRSSAWIGLEARAEAQQMKQAEVIGKLIRDFARRKPDSEEPKAAARPDHTAGIVVIDAQGNIAALNHSVTSALWGELGLFVDGVSVVDPGAFAQAQIQLAGPGVQYVPHDMMLGAPAIVLKDGCGYLGCGNVGSSFDVVTLQGLVNMLEYEMTPDETLQQPMFRKNWPPGQPVRQPIGEGAFPCEVLAAVKAKGIDIEPVEDPAQATAGGIWVVAARDSVSGGLNGAVTIDTAHAAVSDDYSGLIEAY